MAKVNVDGISLEAQPDELLIDLVNRVGGSVPHVCYHPQLGPVQTCDTCMVEVNGRLIRACATAAAEGMGGLHQVSQSSGSPGGSNRPRSEQSHAALQGLR